MGIFSFYIMPPALMGCGWLIVIGMLRVWRLLNVAWGIEVPGPMPFEVGVPPCAIELSEAGT